MRQVQVDAERPASRPVLLGDAPTMSPIRAQGINLPAGQRLPLSPTERRDMDTASITIEHSAPEVRRLQKLQEAEAAKDI